MFTKRLQTLITIFFLFLAGIPLAGAQETPRPFRIGFLLSGEGKSSGLNWYESLRRALLEQPTVKEALLDNNFSGISLLPADGYRDMLQRMDINEFDLAICPSVIFVEQKGDYRPILQMRGDISDSRGQGTTLRKGAVIMGKSCPLFTLDNPAPEKIRAHISSNPMVFVSPFNAAGYIYPRAALRRRFDVADPRDIIFAGSSEEVVKFVISGLVPIGACETEAIDAVLKSAAISESKERLIRILFEAPPAPTDPIVLRDALQPQKSLLGREIKQTLKIFYNNSKRTDVPRVTDSRDENFKNLREEIAVLQELK